MMYPNDSNFIGAKFKLEHYANDKIHGFAVTSVISVFANFFSWCHKEKHWIGNATRAEKQDLAPAGDATQICWRIEIFTGLAALESPSVRQISSILTREKHGKTEKKPGKPWKNMENQKKNHGFLEVTHFWRTQHAWHVHALWRCDVLEVIHQLLKGRRDNIQFVRCTTSSIGDLGEFGFGQLISYICSMCFFSMFFWGSEAETSY